MSTKKRMVSTNKRLFCIRRNDNNKVVAFKDDAGHIVKYYSTKDAAKHTRDQFIQYEIECHISYGPDHKRYRYA